MSHVVVIGAGIGGLTTAALLTKAGYQVTVLEAQSYVGGCAGTFFYKGFKFDAGATVAGGFQTDGPHNLIEQELGIKWPVHRYDPAWVVALPDREIEVNQDGTGISAKFPHSAKFWEEQRRIADITWKLSSSGLPWPPANLSELQQLITTVLPSIPDAINLLPYAFISVEDWLRKHNLDKDIAFTRFIDAGLLISAQATSKTVNALYGATALDLPRQGVYHVEGGMGGLSDTLLDYIRTHGNNVYLRHNVDRIHIRDNHAVAISGQKGVRNPTSFSIEADAVIANMTPWSLEKLLGKQSPRSLRKQLHKTKDTWGAFVLHLGIDANKLPDATPEHFQIIRDFESPLGEGNSVFLSISPKDDSTRAPDGFRAATVTTHTNIRKWWKLFDTDKDEYARQKSEYEKRILSAIDQVIPGFTDCISFSLTGTPLTYEHYTGRHLGMVGGFPQESLFKVRGPGTGIPNLRLVGDSIFPGQSTAGVTLGAIRVANDIQHTIPLKSVSSVRNLQLS